MLSNIGISLVVLVLILSFLIIYTASVDLKISGQNIKGKIYKFASLPIFLFLMVVLAAVFTIGSLKHKQNIYFILVAILTCVAIYYFKDLSIALGQTEKISLVLSVWMPIIVISLFCSIGIIHINEK